MDLALLDAEEPGLEQHPVADAGEIHQRSQHCASDTEEPLAVDVIADAAAGEQEQKQEDQARTVRCECCGMAEDFTPGYIIRVRGRFDGRWVCGLCTEAVSERRRCEPALTVGEAVESHASLCSRFNSTVRLNPTLSLARSMREIARGSCLNRVRAAAPATSCSGASKARTIGSCPLPYFPSPAKQRAA